MVVCHRRLSEHFIDCNEQHPTSCDAWMTLVQRLFFLKFSQKPTVYKNIFPENEVLIVFHLLFAPELLEEVFSFTRNLRRACIAPTHRSRLETRRSCTAAESAVWIKCFHQCQLSANSRWATDGLVVRGCLCIDRLSVTVYGYASEHSLLRPSISKQRDERKSELHVRASLHHTGTGLYE